MTGGTAAILMGCALGFLVGGCGGGPRRSGGQMMLVSEASGSAGYRKLMSRSEEFGDLRQFISENGLPDFVTEANSSDRTYLIFYYLDRHQAFACRTLGRRPGVEFAGPYAITQGEWKLLSKVKEQAGAVSAAR